MQHLKFVILKLREVNLKLNLSKCEFAKTIIRILGHVLSREGTQLDQRKIKA